MEDLNKQWLEDNLPIAFNKVQEQKTEVLQHIAAPKHKLHDDFGDEE